MKLAYLSGCLALLMVTMTMAEDKPTTDNSVEPNRLLGS